MRLRHRSGRLIALSVAVVVLIFGAWTALRWNAPPLRLRQRPGAVLVDVQTLGEYPTTISRIRLIDLQNSSVVWEIQANDDVPQIHQFTLNVGQNPTKVNADHGTFRTVTPANAHEFTLGARRPYKVEIWGGTSILSKKSATFRFGD